MVKSGMERRKVQPMIAEREELSFPGKTQQEPKSFFGQTWSCTDCCRFRRCLGKTPDARGSFDV